MNAYRGARRWPAWILLLVPAQGVAGDLVEEVTRLKAAGQFEAALTLLARAEAGGALTPAARRLQVEILLRRQDAEAAQAAAQAGLQQEPGSAYLRLCLGDACWLLRDLDAAHASYQQVASGTDALAATARQRLTALDEDRALVRRAATLVARSTTLSWVAGLGLLAVAVLVARRAGMGGTKNLATPD